MTSNVVALPVLIPAVTGLVMIAVNGHRQIEDRLALASGALLTGCAAWLCAVTAAGTFLVLPIGAWGAGIGIVWVIDRLSAIMLLLSALTSMAVLVYAEPALQPGEERRFYHPMHQLLLVGVNGAFVTADLFNLFVFFEVMLVASFVLISVGGVAAQLREAFPYVLLNLIASALLFTGVGVIYATAGTVDMASLASKVGTALPWAFTGGLALVLVVFSIKAALVPVFFWLPGSYPRAPLPVSAYFAGLLTKVGVYTLYRAFTLFESPTMLPFRRALLVVAAATMLVGVIGALGRSTLRGILSFHIISQVGYMVFGLALFTPAGIAAGIFYVAHHIVVKTALFLAAGTAELVGGGGRLGQARGLGATHPWLGLAFLVPALALAGIPPLSGFWGKALLIVAGFEAEAYVETTVAIVVSLLTLASMLKIWFATFWGSPEGQVDPDAGRKRRLLAPPLGLAALSACIGLGAPLVWSYAEATAADLLDPSGYVGAILLTRGP